MKIHHYLLALICLCLSACTSQYSHSGPNSPQAMTHWQIDGVVGLNYGQNHNSANFNWIQQSKNTYQIHLFGPFGLGSAKLTASKDQISLVHNGRTYMASSPEQLVQDNLGWQIPISPLYYWIRGLAAPNTPAQLIHNPQGQISQIQQDGWQIDYLNYTDLGRLSLPNRIQLSRPSEKVRLLLIVSHWKLNS